MASSEDIKTFDRRMEPHRTSIGEERNVIKGVFKEMRKAGIEPVGFKMAKKLESLKPTKRAAVLQSFRETLSALGLDAQAEMPFGVIQGGKAEDEAPRAGARAKVSDSLKPPSRGKVRGKGGLNRQPDSAA